MMLVSPDISDLFVCTAVAAFLSRGLLVVWNWVDAVCYEVFEAPSLKLVAVNVFLGLILENLLLTLDTLDTSSYAETLE